MLRLCLSLCEEISQTELRRHIEKGHKIMKHLRSHKEASVPMCLVSSCLIGSRAILIAPVLLEESGVGVEDVTPKSSSSHRSLVTLAIIVIIALNSAAALE